MKKFPVISENGNEYLVKIRRSFGVHIYEVIVYERRKIFGVPYFNRLNGGFLDDNEYDALNYDYDFVEMAKAEINRLEHRWELQYLREKVRNIGVGKFEEWDGDMRNE